VGRRRPAWRTWVRLLVAALVGATGAIVAVASPAQACFIDPDTGQCLPPPPNPTYQVTGADSNGLANMTQPFGKGTNGSAFIKWFPNGTSLHLLCQANNGGQVDGRVQYGRPFTTWDKLTDGTWVYDWYMNTPLVQTDGYSTGFTHCNWSASSAGTYHVTGAPNGVAGIYSEPHVNNVIRTAANGTALTVQCQVNNGSQLDGRTQYGRPFLTWDKLSDGTWIYDWYMDTPLVQTDGYSSRMPHCGAESSKRFVALGDSYSSGQGTYNYFGSNPTNCRRSTQTYSYVWARTYSLPSWLPERTDPILLACGGATLSALTSSYNGELPQLNTGDLGPLTKLVTISIGGNDVGFPDILEMCMDRVRHNDNCWQVELNDPGSDGYIAGWTGAYQMIDALKSSLVSAYNQIRFKAPYAKIIVVGYPMIFPTSVLQLCGWSLGVPPQMSANSLHAIRDTWAHMNAIVKSAAAQAGVYFMDDSASWAGHDFCTAVPFAQGIKGFDPVNGDFDADFESYHPNADGYWQMAYDLNSFIYANFP
jgi:hypothetical protein